MVSYSPRARRICDWVHVHSLRATGATRFKNIARQSSTLCACQIEVLCGVCTRSPAKPDTACDDTLTTGRLG